MMVAEFLSTDGQTVAEVLRRTGAAIERMRPDAVKAMQSRGVEVVKGAGGRYHIHNRKGGKVSLSAKAGTKTTSTASVLGVPLGVWVLVEEGSIHKPGGWDIVSRRAGKKPGSSRVIRRLKKTGEFRAGTFVGVRPLRTPYGPRFHVHHPHIGGFGHPWEEATIVLERDIPNVVDRSIVKSVSTIWG